MSVPAFGRLVLMPNTLDLGSQAVELSDVLPLGVIHRASALAFWVAENARSTRGFLKRVHAIAPATRAMQDISIVELPRPRKGGPAGPAAPEQWHSLLAPALRGDDLGLISEAGLPGVADPGAGLVSAAHRLGVPVLALAGPSSITLAVAASGLNGQSFAFVGYLPVDAQPRLARVRELEALSRRTGQSQVFIETPYRNAAMLGGLLDALSDTTRLSVSCGLTLPDGWTRTDAVSAWKTRRSEMPDRTPAVFVLLAC